MKLPAFTALTTTSAFRTWPGFIDSNGSTVEGRAIHNLDCGLTCGRVIKGHESETPAAASVPICDDLGICDLSKLLESGPEGNVVCGPSKATNEELLRHLLTPLRRHSRRRTGSFASLSHVRPGVAALAHHCGCNSGILSPAKLGPKTVFVSTVPRPPTHNIAAIASAGVTAFFWAASPGTGIEEGDLSFEIKALRALIPLTVSREVQGISLYPGLGEHRRALGIPRLTDPPVSPERPGSSPMRAASWASNFARNDPQTSQATLALAQ